MTAEARICPRCNSPMVLRTAARGRYAGRQFWGCSTYPSCSAVINVEASTVASPDASTGNSAGVSARRRFVEAKNRRAERIRRMWPPAVGVAIVLMLAAYLAVSAWLNEGLGALAAVGVAVILVLAVTELPQVVDAWRVGAEGEEKTARYLDGLDTAGFVVLNDRRGAGYGGNLDHIAIGPTGVWVIETKSYRGEVVIRGDRLEINDQPRDKIIDQVYREAVAVQIAMGDRLTDLGLTVTPVLCLHRAKLGWLDKSVRGVRLVDGRGLVKLMRGGNRRLSDDNVQSLAAELDRLFRPAAGA